MENFQRRHGLFTAILILLLIVYCNCKNLEERIQDYVDKEEIISNIFQPHEKVGEGGAVMQMDIVVYQGDIDLNKVDKYEFIDNAKNKSKTKPSTPTSSEHRDWKLVAMKFTEDYAYFEREQRIYMRLKAYKNKSVEQYGIPSVWFKGELMKKAYAIGMTLCEASIYDKKNEYGGKLEDVDLLVVFYQVLRALKYIHGKEVIHEDLIPKNIVLKGTQLFLIDFDMSDWIYERDRPLGSMNFGSIIHYFDGMWRFYMDDLKSLYYLLLDLAGIQFPWSRYSNAEIEKAANAKFQFYATRDLTNKIESEPVRELLVDYYNAIMINTLTVMEVEEDKRIFKYDDWGNRIQEVINKLTGSYYPWFTWLTDAEKREDKRKFKPIEEVVGPSPIDLNRPIIKRPVIKNNTTTKSKDIHCSVM